MAYNRGADHATLLASARRVKRIREALGLTQRDFSYYLRVAVPTLSAWERAAALPSPLAQASIRTVAIEFGLDLHTMEAFE